MIADVVIYKLRKCKIFYPARTSIKYYILTSPCIFTFLYVSLWTPSSLRISMMYQSIGMIISIRRYGLSVSTFLQWHTKRMDLFDARVIPMHVQISFNPIIRVCSSLYPALSLPRGDRRLRNFGRDSSRIHVYALRNYASLYIRRCEEVR